MRPEDKGDRGGNAPKPELARGLIAKSRKRFKADLQNVLDDITMPYTDYDIEVAQDKLRAVIDKL